AGTSQSNSKVCSIESAMPAAELTQRTNAKSGWIILFMLSHPTPCLSRARVSERRLETFVRLLRNEPSRRCRNCSAQRRAERNECALIATSQSADSVHVSLLQPTELRRPTER